MKSKQEIYNNTVELIEKQDKANYLAYYKVFLENSSRNDILQEEKESIIKAAYEIYKRQSEELEEIRELAYLDLVADNNGYNQAI
ncbi:MAG: hypothetical protein ACLVKT_14625 [Intestinibacter bartlettii]|jgi:hypothetical protein|uniref:hypothetical protein n=1 Tax=Intestinibacter bartlettii TaxID=261299 RepID=UPI00399B0B6D